MLKGWHQKKESQPPLMICDEERAVTFERLGLAMGSAGLPFCVSGPLAPQARSAQSNLRQRLRFGTTERRTGNDHPGALLSLLGPRPADTTHPRHLQPPLGLWEDAEPIWAEEQ